MKKTAQKNRKVKAQSVMRMAMEFTRSASAGLRLVVSAILMTALTACSDGYGWTVIIKNNSADKIVRLKIIGVVYKSEIAPGTQMAFHDHSMAAFGPIEVWKDGSCKPAAAVNTGIKEGRAQTFVFAGSGGGYTLTRE
jgi:hypothetical protein